MNPLNQTSNTPQSALLWAFLGSFPASQQDYDDLAKDIREIYLSNEMLVFERFPIIWPNLGANQAQIAQRMRAANGTFLRDQRFGTLTTLRAKVNYLCNECPAGYHYIVGRMNRRLHDCSFTKWAQTTPKDWHFSLNVKKPNETEGIIVNISTSKHSMECHAEALTEENVAYYFSDLYISFYYSLLPLESEATKAVAAKIRLPSQLRKLRRHREKQAKKRELSQLGALEQIPFCDGEVKLGGAENAKQEESKKIRVLRVDGKLCKYRKCTISDLKPTAENK